MGHIVFVLPADLVAMYYVELHAATHAKLQAVGERWKFNKARQGWLMRNVWNDTEVSTRVSNLDLDLDLDMDERPTSTRVMKHES